MRLLLCNDDGIDAPGLEALAQACAGLGELVVVAPDAERSNCGHAVTTRAPLVLSRRGPSRWMVAGTPADCVRVALAHLDLRPAWVISGINPGGNLGADVVHSGTVAAAREAAFRGLPALAVSHYLRRGVPVDWPRAAALLAGILPGLLASPPAAGRYLNCNLPHLDAGAPAPELRRVPLDPSPLPLAFASEGEAVRYRGDYQARQRLVGHDVATCFGGAISLSELACC